MQSLCSWCHRIVVSDLPLQKRKGNWTEMYPTIVSELVTENAPASGHFSRPVSVTESNSTQFVLVSKKRASIQIRMRTESVCDVHNRNFKILDYEQSPFSLKDSRASETRASVKIRVSPFSRGVIFTCSRVSLARLSLRENGDYSQSVKIQRSDSNENVA